MLSRRLLLALVLAAAVAAGNFFVAGDALAWRVGAPFALALVVALLPSRAAAPPAREPAPPPPPPAEPAGAEALGLLGLLQEEGRFVGIDLGTTNTACAFVDTAAGRALRVFEVPQLVAPGEMGARPTLPSFLYLAGAHELPAGSLDPPWTTGRAWCVGLLAREQGARVPGRLVASSKSWLCHAAVDRTAPILPWGAGDEVPKVSPVEASARTLTHLREAWDASFPAPLAEQHVVLTVPASFDAVARELTLAAASAAGLPEVVMLEEPQAAFYACLAANQADWRARLAAPARAVGGRVRRRATPVAHSR